MSTTTICLIILLVLTFNIWASILLHLFNGMVLFIIMIAVGIAHYISRPFVWLYKLSRKKKLPDS